MVETTTDRKLSRAVEQVCAAAGHTQRALGALEKLAAALDRNGVGDCAQIINAAVAARRPQPGRTGPALERLLSEAGPLSEAERVILGQAAEAWGELVRTEGAKGAGLAGDRVDASPVWRDPEVRAERFENERLLRLWLADLERLQFGSHRPDSDDDVAVCLDRFMASLIWGPASLSGWDRDRRSRKGTARAELRYCLHWWRWLAMAAADRPAGHP